MAHGLQCLCDGRACCPVLLKQLVICRFLRFHRRQSRCCFKSLFHRTGTGCCEFPTEWNPYQQVNPRTYGAWACLAHALCSVCAKQLVICRFLRFHRRRVSTCGLLKSYCGSDSFVTFSAGIKTKLSIYLLWFREIYRYA